MTWCTNSNRSCACSGSPCTVGTCSTVRVYLSCDPEVTEDAAEETTYSNCQSMNSVTLSCSTEISSALIEMRSFTDKWESSRAASVDAVKASTFTLSSTACWSNANTQSRPCCADSC